MAVVDVDIFECERYKPFVGWSKDYLWPTDANAYRIRGCRKVSWKTLSEVETALISPGWTWEKLLGANGTEVNWQASPQPHSDSEGWLYSFDFNHNFEGTAKRGAQAFARWRRLARSQAFAGEGALALAVAAGRGTAAAGEVAALERSSCPHVDLEAAGHLGQRLLEALAAGTLYHTENSMPTLVKLKRQLAEKLLQQDSSSSRSSTTGSQTADAALTEFVGAQRSVAARMAEAFKGADDTAIRARMAEIEERFPAAEREAFAFAALRRFSPELTCPADNVGEHDCRFRPVVCGHVGCRERMSAYAVETHNEVCRFVPIACEACNEKIPKGEMRTHIMAACPCREAKCAFHSIGCDKPLTHQSVPAHLDECIQSHLLLVLGIVTEQQDVIRSLTSRVYELEKRATAHDAESQAGSAIAQRVVVLERQTSKLSDLEAQLGGHQKRSADEVRKAQAAAAEDAKRKADAAGLEAKKKADAAVASVQKEIQAVKAQVADHGKHAASNRPLEERLRTLEAAVAPGAGRS